MSKTKIEVRLPQLPPKPKTTSLHKRPTSGTNNPNINMMRVSPMKLT